MKKLFILFLIFLSLNVFAEEKYFSGNNYTARVNERGLVSLVSGGQEFIGPQGCYFYNSPNPYTGSYTGVAEGNKWTVTSEVGSVEYVFGKDKIDFVFKNKNGSNYFIGLSPYAQPINNKRIRKRDVVLEAETELFVWGFSKDKPEIDFLARWHQAQHIRDAWTFSTLTEAEKEYIYPEKYDFVLYSPKNYEVFQRQSKDFGKVAISGKVKGDDLTYTIQGVDFNKKNLNITKPIVVDKFGSFKENVTVPSGGWYKLILNWTENGTKKSKIIEHFGVGEVIITAGQSNACNNAETKTKQESGFVASTDGVNWQYGDDPQLGPISRAMGGSMYPSLGDILYKEFNVPIGFALVGSGGTLVEQWQPWSKPAHGQGPINLYNNMMKRIYELGQEGFRCVIWHQGEGDIGSDPTVIYDYMANMINRSRFDAGWNVPWFTAKASYHNPEHSKYEKVREVQQRLWDENISFQGPDTDTLLSEYREFNGTGIHFNPLGLKKHAQMWADCLVPYINSQIE